MVDDILEFDLTANEVSELVKYPEVISVDINDTKFYPHYTKIGQTGIPKIASYNYSFAEEKDVKSQFAYSLLHCQKSELLYADNPYTLAKGCSLSSIDCSNVDILILDSGIDKTHPDFFDQNNEQQAVEFNWTQLKEGDPLFGTQIVSTQSESYYNDTLGHGTSCASLIAGKRNGFAKNAKIYSLRSNELGSTTSGFYIDTCLKLTLAFQKAKKLNLFNLQSNRPTIFSNSWGVVGPKIADDLENDVNTLKFYSSIDGGKNTFSYNSLPGNNSVIDGYIRQILAEGVHVVVSAGNINAYLTNTTTDVIDLHCFRRTESSSTVDYVTVKTEANKTKYTQNATYGYNYKYGSTNGLTTTRRYHCYQSPNIGLNQSKINFPIIVVGDVIPIGNNEEDYNIYWSSGSSKSVNDFLLNLPSNETRIINDGTTCYNSIAGPFFVKSAYSSFGPAVDIYAPGNGVWAAFSNQVSNTQSPLISAGYNERYYFFNGTSAACPIVVGSLATILAENPNLTPLEAKSTLLSLGVKGSIMETQASTVSLSSYGAYSYTLSCYMGAERDLMSSNSNYRIQNGGPSYFRTGNIEDMLFCCRFFNSNNILCQAYPLREAILSSNQTSATIGRTVLTNTEETSLKITHQVD